MSAETESTPPAPSAWAQLHPAALAQLVLAFHFSFWGLLVLLTALAESLVTTYLRPLSGILIGSGSLALAAGAWRMHQVIGLGDSWRRRTRCLVIVTVLDAYLSLFFIMWRQMPTNAYLLAHTLVFFALLLTAICLLCLPVMELAHAADRPGLAVQAGAFGTVAVVLLLPPFGLIAEKMLEANQAGADPFGLLQFWVTHTSLWITLVWLVPFSLTLSLLWSAKDLVLDRLTPPEN